MYFLQLLVVGLLAGAVYSFVGVGFTLVLGVGKVPNFAHGAFVGFGLYFALFMNRQFGLSPFAAVPVGIVFFALVGFVCADIFERRGRRAGEIGHLLIGLALLLVIQGGLEALYGDDPQVVKGGDIGYWNVLDIGILYAQVVAALVAILVAAGLYAWLRISRFGRAMRAVAANPSAAALFGIRVPIVVRAAVTISVVLAGVAGILISPFTVLTPDIGSTFIITAFAVVLVGGIGNTLGALLAGLGVGVLDSLTSGYLASYWTTLAPLLVILAFLIFRREEVAA